MVTANSPDGTQIPAYFDGDNDPTIDSDNDGDPVKVN